MGKLFEALQRSGRHARDLYTGLLDDTQTDVEPRPADAPVPEATCDTRRPGIAFQSSDARIENVTLTAANRIVVHSAPRSSGADRFRLLKMRIQQVTHTHTVKTLLVTSPLPRDGKSTVVLNLATVLSEQGKRKVLVIDGDLHHSSLCSRLGLIPHPGLAECLEQRLSAFSNLRYLRPLEWYLLGAGAACSSPTDLLQSAMLSTVIQSLSPYFDWILIDSPPVLAVADTAALKEQADATVLVVRSGSTPRDTIDAAITQIGSKHVLAIVLNGIEGVDQLYCEYHTPYARSSSSGR